MSVGLEERLFPDSAAIDGAAPAEGRMKWEEVPAKCAVYALYTVEEKPLLLATVGNLRAALQRRLTDAPREMKSKRIPYGELCTRAYWRVVHSPLAADFYYYHAAKALFPQTYREIIPRRSTWWLALERGGGEVEFPKIRRTQDLSDGSLRYAGPIRDKSAAAKLGETLEDLFDLCRYHHILVQAPEGKACAYKEMGKCPAPCDGSVAMSWYQGQIRAAFDFLLGATREQWFANTQTAMKSAAAVQEFELANRIKQRLTRANYIFHEAFAHLRPLEEFSYLSLQPGKGKLGLEPWLMHGAGVEPLPQLHRKTLEVDVGVLFSHLQQAIKVPIPAAFTASETEQLGIVAHHLFRGEKNDTRFFPTRTITTPGVLLDLATRCFLQDAPAKALSEHSSDVPAAEPEIPVGE